MTPIITNFSPELGPVGQPIIITVENFVEGQSQIFFGDTEILDFKYLVESGEIRFCIPEGLSGTNFFKVITPEGEFTTSNVYTVGIPTDPPAVIGIVTHPGISTCVYIYGMNFTYGTTTVNYNGTELPVFVYTPTEGSFTKTDALDVITAFTLTTSNGSINHTIY